MKILQRIFTGLGTKPVNQSPADSDLDPSADCGMLGAARDIAILYPEHKHTILAFGWDQQPISIACPNILAATKAEAPDVIIDHFHSFGANLWLAYHESLEKFNPEAQKTDLGLGNDPCEYDKPWNPFPKKYFLDKWSPSNSMVRSWIVHFQDAGRPFVSGTPFIDGTNGIPSYGASGMPINCYDSLGNLLQPGNIDVASWVNPTLAHITIFDWTGIIMDYRVRSRVIQEAVKVVTARIAEGTA